jgi:hypothetical protein
VIRTINVSTITKAVQDMLREAPPYSQGELTVERGQPLNKVPARCPWVGVYRQSVSFESRALGLGAGYRRQRVELALVLKARSAVSGEDCEEALEALLQNVESVLLSDPSLRGNVDVIDTFSVRYSDYVNEGNAFFQEAVLQFAALVNVSAT